MSLHEPSGSAILDNQENGMQIKERFAEVMDRVENAAQKSGRSMQEVTVIAVSKTHPIETVQEAIECGICHFAENRIQEAEEKIPQQKIPGVTWHLVGHLQRNKARNAIQLFDRFHALDSKRLARRLQKQLAKENVEKFPAYVQVNTSGEESKYGIEPEELESLLGVVSDECPLLKVEGLMTVAPFTDDETVLRKTFAALRNLMEKTDDTGYHNVELRDLSMGMTNDYEIAIEEGATHLRIGRAIFGERRRR